MSDPGWVPEPQMARLAPIFPRSGGTPRIDDRPVLSAMIFLNRNGLRWRNAPAECGPHRTLRNRWKRWSDKGIFARMMAGLAAEHGEAKTRLIDATHLSVHRTATGLGLNKGARGCPIGRTKVDMNTKPRAICDSQSRPLNLFVSAVQVSDWIGTNALPNGCLATVATMQIAFEER